MPIQIGAKGATLFGNTYPPYAYIDWFTPDQEAQAKAGGDAFDTPSRGFTPQETLQLKGVVSDARITTWANRAALVTAGLTTAFFTDVGIGGGSWWYYTGGRWRPTGGRVVLRNLTSSVTHNTTTRTVMDYALLQAGLWQDGDILEDEWCKTLTGTDTDATETALGTVAGTFGESMIIATSGLTNANPMVSARWRWRRLGATSVRVVSVGGSTGLGAVGAVLADPTITTNLDTTDSYLQISGDLTTGGGAVTALRAHTVTLVCGA